MTFCNLRIASFLFFSLLTASCEPTNNEEKAIDSLNNKYKHKKYEIKYFPHTINNYLTLHLHKNKVDSIEITKIFDDAMLIAKDSVTQERKLVWTYMIVYDSSHKYLFTLKKSEGKTKFFIGSVF
jgi:hypothetical protein